MLTPHSLEAFGEAERIKVKRGSVILFVRREHAIFQNNGCVGLDCTDRRSEEVNQSVWKEQSEDWGGAQC